MTERKWKMAETHGSGCAGLVDSCGVGRLRARVCAQLTQTRAGMAHGADPLSRECTSEGTHSRGSVGVIGSVG
jgi:hypothetical protein